MYTIDDQIEQLSLNEMLEMKAYVEGYKSVPVDINQFIEDDYYLGKVYGGENSDGSPVIYPYWRKKLTEIFPNPFSSPFEECNFSGAIGVGKTTIALIGILYDLYRLTLLKNPQDKYGIAKTTVIGIALFTVTKTLGSIVLWSQLSDVFRDSPYFKSIYKFNRSDGTCFPNKIGFSFGSRFSDALGQAIIAAIMDEANFQDFVADQAIESYNAIKRRMISRFMGKEGSLPFRFWKVSSKKEKNAFLEEQIDKERNNPKVLTIEPPIYEVHSHRNIYSGKKFKVYTGDDKLDPFIVEDEVPNHIDIEDIIEVPIEYKKEYENDIIGALRDISGISTTSVRKLFRSKEKLNKVLVVPPAFTKEIISLTEYGEDVIKDYLTDHLRNINNPSQARYIHVDTASTGDKLGLAMSQSVGNRVVKRLNMKTGLYNTFEEHVIMNDFVLGVEAMPGIEIPFFKIREFIVYLRDELHFNIVLVTTDGYQSLEFRQLLRQQNFETDKFSVDISKDPYISYKRAVIEDRVISPRNSVLRFELLDVEDTGKKIDHTKEGSKDLSDAVVGSFCKCQELAFSNQLYVDDMIKDMEKDLNNKSLFGMVRR